MGFPSVSVVKNLSVNAGDMSSIPCQEDPLEKEMATHYSIAWNPMDRRTWRATVYGVVKKSWTLLWD